MNDSDKGLQHVTHDGLVIKAAPHPMGGELNQKEYYMTDARGDGFTPLAMPGETHRVVYWLDGSGMKPRILYHAYESVAAAARALSDYTKLFSAFHPEDVIKQLRETLAAVEKLSVPKPSEFQGMPYLGQMVWVINPSGTPVEVKVTEVTDMNGVMSVIFGSHHKPNGEWFWNKEAAEAYANSAEANTRAKNVFLGDKS